MREPEAPAKGTSGAMLTRIGLLCGMETSFPPEFLARCNRVPGVEAELAKIGGIAERFRSPYDVLIDRISQEVTHYRFALKAAALAGAYVINDPFWWSADDKFFGYSLVQRAGVAVPRTVMLPQKDYISRIDKNRSLRNLEFPLDWERIMDYVGFPAILKPADGGGWRDVSIVKSPAELLRAYDASNTMVMTLQQFVDFDEYVRCICIGKDQILPIQYSPSRRCYVLNQGDGWLPRDLMDRIVTDARTINNLLGYDMNSVEFAIKDGVPYAIDFTNPAPDMAKEAIHEPYFEVIVDWMVELAVRAARDPKMSTAAGYRWNEWNGAVIGGPQEDPLRPGDASQKG
jgi:glutathione synthase/RimK-type ligase-like ATP-grasp enzyme